MMTSSNGNIFRVTGHLCGEFTGPGEFPTQRPVTRSFDVFFDLRLNKRLSKQPWGWWFETSSWSLWRQCNEWYRFDLPSFLLREYFCEVFCLLMKLIARTPSLPSLQTAHAWPTYDWLRALVHLHCGALQRNDWLRGLVRLDFDVMTGTSTINAKCSWRSFKHDLPCLRQQIWRENQYKWDEKYVKLTKRFIDSMQVRFSSASAVSLSLSRSLAPALSLSLSIYIYMIRQIKSQFSV